MGNKILWPIIDVNYESESNFIWYHSTSYKKILILFENYSYETNDNSMTKNLFKDLEKWLIVDWLDLAIIASIK